MEFFARKDGSSVFLGGQNFALWQQKVKSSAKCTKGFYLGGKKKKTEAQKVPYFEQKNSEIIIFLQ